jgi:hypothetical protein
MPAADVVCLTVAPSPQPDHAFPKPTMIQSATEAIAPATAKTQAAIAFLFI